MGFASSCAPIFFRYRWSYRHLLICQYRVCCSTSAKTHFACMLALLICRHLLGMQEYVRKLGTCLVELSADSQNRDATERLQKWVTEVNSIFAITCICKQSGLASFRRSKMDDATILPDMPPSDAVYHETMVRLTVYLLCPTRLLSALPVIFLPPLPPLQQQA